MVLKSGKENIKPFQFVDIEKIKYARKEKKEVPRFEKTEQKGKKSDFRQGGFGFTVQKEDKEAEAKKEAEKYLSEAKLKAERIEREAYEKGLEEGKSIAMEEGRKAVVPLIETVKKILTEVSGLKGNIYKTIESEMLELIFAVSESVIHREIAADKEMVLNTIKAAVAGIIGKEEIAIKVNPEDLEAARKIKTDIMSSINGLKNVAIDGDPSIGRGGCVVETNFGSIDARIEQQIEEIKQTLKIVNSQ
jgi:flagellar assembly protein FliH